MAKAKDKKNNLFKHGGYSLIKKYQEGKIDRRTSIGKYIEDVKNGFIEEIGDPSSPQKVLLELILQKILFISAIGDYCTRRGNDILNSSGELLPCLSKNYIAFSNALVRDIRALFELQAIKKKSSREVEQDAYLKAITGQL